MAAVTSSAASTPTVTERPLLTIAGGINIAMYYVPRRFTKDSKLHAWLAKCRPDLILRGRRDYNLYEVINLLFNK